MGIWVTKASLRAGEQPMITFTANHSAGKRAVGGRVTLSDTALYFTPNRLDALTGGMSLILARSDVDDVSVADRTAKGGPFAGGARKRLTVSTSRGPVLFVVNHVEERVAEIRKCWDLPGQEVAPPT